MRENDFNKESSPTGTNGPRGPLRGGANHQTGGMFSNLEEMQMWIWENNPSIIKAKGDAEKVRLEAEGNKEFKSAEAYEKRKEADSNSSDRIEKNKQDTINLRSDRKDKTIQIIRDRNITKWVIIAFAAAPISVTVLGMVFFLSNNEPNTIGNFREVIGFIRPVIEQSGLLLAGFVGGKGLDWNKKS